MKLPGTLPTPTLTAILTFTTNNAEFARVEILGPDGARLSRRRLAQIRAEGTDRKPTTCTACGQQGHARSNKRCPKRTAL